VRLGSECLPKNQCDLLVQDQMPLLSPEQQCQNTEVTQVDKVTVTQSRINVYSGNDHLVFYDMPV